MPDDETLAEMYGPGYAMSFAADPSVDDPKEPEKVLALLAKGTRGTFVDYGCGKGDLLSSAEKLGWNAVGVEFDDEVVRQLRERLGLTIMTSLEAVSSEPLADVLHLGDVIEHMTKINEQMPAVLKLIRPGGRLVAQGPLEGNFNVFTMGIRLSRKLRPAPVEMAPYHVLLATRQGQEECFKRFGLEPEEFSVSEVAWPAPARLTRADLVKPRALGLYGLRRLSQGVSTIQSRWGNRYFYVGHKR
jgi:SAM-dependent methyltransferase